MGSHYTPRQTDIVLPIINVADTSLVYKMVQLHAQDQVGDRKLVKDK